MRIPGYRALREIRSGRLGTLYTARKWTGRKVYIRVLRDDRYGDPSRMEEARERLQRIRGVAAPIERGVLEDGRRYIVSAGEPVNMRWRRFYGGPWEAVIAALAVAHERGVVHGNLGEESIVTEGERLIITDFGLAPIIDEQRADQYAPERRWYEAESRQQLRPQTDQYELGLMMLRGRFGWPTIAQLMERATRESPERRFESTWDMIPWGESSPYVYRRFLTHWTPLQLAGQFVSAYSTVIQTTLGTATGAAALWQALHLAPPDRPIHDPFFNTWFETRDVEREKVVETLQPETPYWFAFDISRFPYEAAGTASWTPSESLRRELERARQARLKILRLVVRPVLAGRGLTFPGSSGSPMEVWSGGAWRQDRKFLGGDAIELEIDLARLRDPIRVPASPGPEDHEGRAGGVRLPLYATKDDGCAAVALSIWKNGEAVPLDHLVAQVPVGNGRCPETRATRAATDNFIGSLIDPSDLKPAAAIHLFELGESGQDVSTVAVYAAPAGLESSCDHYSWPLKRSIAAFIAAVPPADIEDARTSDHQLVAHRIAQELFPTGRKTCDDGAALALAHLQRVAQTPSQIVFARAVEPRRQQFLPLNLVFALREGGVPAFAHRPLLVQPLQRASYAAGRQCIADFAYFLPNKLEGPGAIALDPELRHLEQAAELRRDQEKLMTYMTDSGSPQPANGTLLLVLAHHGGGDLYFDDAKKPWTTSRLGRKFAPGSVAVLAACSSAAVSRDHTAIVAELNRHNFDAAIVAPFDIPANTGIRLAMNFARNVEHARKHRQTPTIAELFARSVEQSAGDLTKAKATQDASAVREFFLAGNGGLRLCESPSSPSSAASSR